jgi:hypothetical protein
LADTCLLVVEKEAITCELRFHWLPRKGCTSYTTVPPSDGVHSDNVAEWLRRRPAKALGSARESSNLFVVEFLLNPSRSSFSNQKWRQNLNFSHVTQSRCAALIFHQTPPPSRSRCPSTRSSTQTATVMTRWSFGEHYCRILRERLF